MPANANYGQMEASTAVTWLNKNFIDSVFEGTPTLAKFQSRLEKGMPGGRRFIVPLMTTGNNTAAWMTSGYDEFSLEPQAGLTAAEYPIVALGTSCVLSELEQAQNSGPDARVDLWKSKVKQAKLTMTDIMSQGIHSDGTDETGQITGLAALIESSGTYGGIARSGNTFWQAYEDNTAEALDDDDMLVAYNTASRGGRTYPDLIVTTQALWQKYHAMLVPNVRYEDERMANLGFRSLMFMGTPIVWDPDCPAGVMYFINTEFIKLLYLEGYNMTWTPKMRPVRQLVDTMLCRWYGAMAAESVRHQAKLTAKT
jgi:hypothetical protein